MRRATRKALQDAERPALLRRGGSIDKAVIELGVAMSPLFALLAEGPPFTEDKWEQARIALVDVAQTAISYVDAFGAPSG